MADLTLVRGSVWLLLLLWCASSRAVSQSGVLSRSQQLTKARVALRSLLTELAWLKTETEARLPSLDGAWTSDLPQHVCRVATRTATPLVRAAQAAWCLAQVNAGSRRPREQMRRRLQRSRFRMAQAVAALRRAGAAEVGRPTVDGAALMSAAWRRMRREAWLDVRNLLLVRDVTAAVTSLLSGLRRRAV